MAIDEEKFYGVVYHEGVPYLCLMQGNEVVERVRVVEPPRPAQHQNDPGPTPATR